jgi:hypothetical protein
MNKQIDSEVYMKGGRNVAKGRDEILSQLSPIARKIYKLIMEKQLNDNDDEQKRKLEEKRRRNEERRKKSIEKDLAEQGQVTLKKMP